MKLVTICENQQATDAAMGLITKHYAAELEPENTVLKAKAFRVGDVTVWAVGIEGRLPEATADAMGKTLAMAADFAAAKPALADEADEDDEDFDPEDGE